MPPNPAERPDDRARLLEISTSLDSRAEDHDPGYLSLEEHQEAAAALRERAADLRAIASRLQPLTWTRERPTVEGHYWYRRDASDTKPFWQIVEVQRPGYISAMGQLHAFFELPRGADELSAVDGEWSNQPLPQPADLFCDKRDEALKAMGELATFTKETARQTS
jgi:hypothetical protein